MAPPPKEVEEDSEDEEMSQCKKYLQQPQDVEKILLCKLFEKHCLMWLETLVMQIHGDLNQEAS